MATIKGQAKTFKSIPVNPITGECVDAITKTYVCICKHSLVVLITRKFLYDAKYFNGINSETRKKLRVLRVFKNKILVEETFTIQLRSLSVVVESVNELIKEQSFLTIT